MASFRCSKGISIHIIEFFLKHCHLELQTSKAQTHKSCQNSLILRSCHWYIDIVFMQKGVFFMMYFTQMLMNIKLSFRVANIYLKKMCKLVSSCPPCHFLHVFDNTTLCTKLLYSWRQVYNYKSFFAISGGNIMAFIYPPLYF